MAEGRQRDDWNHTAELLAMTFNMNRAPKTKPIPAWKLHPFGQPRRERAHMTEEEAWGTFKSLFDRGVFGGQRR